MLKPVCNEDMKVAFDLIAGPPDLQYVGDQGIDFVKVVPTLSTSSKLAGKKIATDKVTVTWLPPNCAYQSGGLFTFVSGTAEIQNSNPTAAADGKRVLLEGDKSLIGCIGSWTNNSTGATVSCSCGVEIVDAGQTEGNAQ